MSGRQAAPKVHARVRDTGLECTQTKRFSKTSELFVWVATVVGILIAPLDRRHSFGAGPTWGDVTYASVGYIDQPRPREGRLEGAQQRQGMGRFGSVADRAGFTPWSSSKFPEHRRNPWVVY